ncbi:MAG: 23S ribosomal RNA methyltransferase Erm [SAR202 cluster bacterium]|nr:dimethyladenosine transferase [Chloroflexota bacterium]MDP6420358.1 23S ribosomal RNA methyltransferase Erm [SAR202 cluster bacterium]MDP6663649.1 23S ribosomal RNA methyltransferase Erm [SAR202 cluster bacterium]MQG70456.1 23S ribosomal RNA methyltransferase Erm [SAR202 cluster bacterium]HAL46786.1 23S ribosomal RNA methyltransferase Erm [Dehalococcoidia bacterium]
MSGQSIPARRRADLSQHFIKNSALAASLVAQTSISAEDLVIEIGPGQGVLTQQLASRCKRLVAIEIDDRMARVLCSQFSDAPQVRIVQGDFLRYELPDQTYKVFANIPFSRTAAIVRRLVDAASPPLDAYLVVQREAAERFCGAPYAGEALQSLLIKPWWQAEIVRRLQRTDFAPPPKVTPVMLWLARRTRPLVSDSQADLYRRFVASAFGQGGATVRQCLRRIFTSRQLGRLARELRFDGGAPPSALTFDQWLGLFRYHSSSSGQHVRIGKPASASRRLKA